MERVFEIEGVDAKTSILVKVDMGEGLEDILNICLDDDPTEIVETFAEKYNLDSGTKESLLTQITQQLNSLKPQPQMEVLSTQARSSKEKQSVFERLYQTTKKKRPVTEEPKPKSSLKINYGALLYIKGTTMKDAKEIRNKKVKEPEYSFTPKINEASKMMSSRILETTESTLLRKGRMYQKNKEDRIKEKEELEAKICTFVPDIHRTEKTLRDIHKELYDDAETRRMTRDLSSEAELRHGKTATQQETNELVNRLMKPIRTCKKVSLREIDLTSPAKDTGESMLSTVKDKRDFDVFEHLYGKRQDRNKKIVEKQECHFQRMEKMRSAKKMSKKSTDFAYDLKRQQIENIFKMLDSDNDGKISTEHIDIDNLDLNVLHTLKPVFNLLDQRSQINLQTFVEVVEKHWDLFSLQQKGHLIKRRHKTELFEQSTKLVSSKSTKIAAKRWNNEDFIDRISFPNRVKHFAREKEKEIKEQQQLREFSFKPSIIKVPKHIKVKL